jgi:hypothetical protein
LIIWYEYISYFLYIIKTKRCNYYRLVERTVFGIIVEAGEGLVVEEAVVSAVLDPGLVVHAHDVGAWVSGQGEARVGKESSGHSVRGQLGSSGALEPYDALALLLTVGDLVRIVAHVDVGGVGQALLARGLIGNSVSTLEEGGLTALADRIDSILVQAARRRDRGVIIQLIATVYGPVVVAMVVHIPVPVVHQPVGTCLLGKGAIDTKVKFIAILVVGVGLNSVLLRAPGILCHSPV